MLAHNITALFALPLLVGYVVLHAWHEGAWRRLPAVALAIGLGLSLSALYWVPALAERSFTSLETNMLGGDNPLLKHLHDLSNLFQPSLAFDFWGQQRFNPALWQALALGAGVLTIAWAPRRLRFALIVFVAALMVQYLLQLSISAAFWQVAPLVRYIQFPWRLLGQIPSSPPCHWEFRSVGGARSVLRAGR